MKNKKNTIMLIMVISISMVLLTWNKSYSYKMDNNEIEEKEVERKEFGIYYQTSGNSYEEKDTFPTQGYLLNTIKTECHEYGSDNVIQNAVTQSLINGVIDGSIIVQSTKSMYCKIYFDKDETPTVSSFNITGKDKNGGVLQNGYTYNTGVYAISWNDRDVAQYCLSDNSSTCTNWVEIGDKSVKTITIENSTYTNTEGPKTIYAYIKDKANNISNTITNSTKQIAVDQTPPVINALTLTGTQAAGMTLQSGYTHTQTVNYNATITETNMEGYCIVDGSSCSNYNTSPITSLSSTIAIGTTQGSHPITLSVKDKAGNIGSKTQSIRLDTQNPTITLSNGTATETSITVTVNASDSNGIASVTCTAVGNNEAKTGTYNSTAKTCTFSGLKDGTQYTIIGVATDESGRKGTSTPIEVTTIKLLTDGQKKAQEVLGVVPKGISEKLLGDMYRFVGTKDTVDNWICFGYSNVDTDCKSPSSDFMYRIIGITEDGQLKLIKNLAYEKYEWNCEDCGRSLHGAALYELWSSSSVRYRVQSDFPTDHLSNLSPGSSKQWSELVETKDWLYGDFIAYNNNPIQNLTANQVYEAESGKVDVYIERSSEYDLVGKWEKTITGKFSLMYVHDFLYSYSSDNSLDSSNTRCTYAGDCKDSWLFIGNSLPETDNNQQRDEWTMTSRGWDYAGWYQANRIGSGAILDSAATNTIWYRPVFYISPTKVKINKGSGVTSSPFIVVPVI